METTITKLEYKDKYQEYYYHRVEFENGEEGQCRSKNEKPPYEVGDLVTIDPYPKKGDNPILFKIRTNSRPANAQSADTHQAKGDYWQDKLDLDKQRFEFDKQKQRLIVLQSSLKEANLYYATHGSKEGVQPEHIFSLAEDWAYKILGATKYIQPDPPNPNKVTEKFERQPEEEEINDGLPF